MTYSLHAVKWVNSIVPYEYGLGFNNEQKNLIELAMDHFHKQTNVRFKRRESERDFVLLMRGNCCSSHVGVRGGVQTVILAQQCFELGIILHELMHVLGFDHKDCGHGPDGHVLIPPERIPSASELESEKSKDVMLCQQLNLDSVPLYHSVLCFYHNCQKVKVKTNENLSKENKSRLTNMDIEKIKLLYPDVPRQVVRVHINLF